MRLKVYQKYFHSYVAGATISTVKFWVNDPQRLSVEDLTNHILKLFIMDL